MTFKRNQTLEFWSSVGFLIIIIVASVADILTDIKHGSSFTHVAQETVILAIAIFMLVRLYLNSLKYRDKIFGLHADLKDLTQISQKMSAELVSAKKAFGHVIENQFNTWGFTKSESEVAWLILKGFNSKEIANYRGLSEKTIRNQLTCIYKKSQQQGKQAFISWFLDGLL